MKNENTIKFDGHHALGILFAVLMLFTVVSVSWPAKAHSEEKQAEVTIDLNAIVAKAKASATLRKIDCTALSESELFDALRLNDESVVQKCLIRPMRVASRK